MFHTDVFKQIEAPWFCYEYAGHHWGTEDIGFFHKLKDNDIPVHIDTQHTVGHLSSQVIDEGDWLYYKDSYLQSAEKKAQELGTNAVPADTIRIIED